ncbi:unnamed protein product, partial [Rotaria socialis]
TLIELELEENIGNYCAIASAVIQIRNDANRYTTDLLSMVIDNNETQFLAEALQNNNTLTILDLESNLIQDDGVKYIFDALKNNKTLNSLELEKYLSNCYALVSAAVKIQNDPIVTCIDLDRKKITDAQAQNLADMLRNNKMKDFFLVNARNIII